MPRWLTGFSVAAFFVLFSSVAFGQRDLGTITGIVADASGAAIPNVKITVVNDATGVATSTQTNESGNYNIPALQPGTYTVTVEATGFQKAQQKNVVVNPGQPTGADIALQVGNATQTVEVTAAAPLL